MKIKLNEFPVQMIFLCSAVMLGFTGELGIGRTRFCLYLIVGFSLMDLFFIRMKKMQILPLLLILISCVVTLFLHGGNPANYLIFILSLTFTIHISTIGITPGTWKLIKAATFVVSIWYIWKFLNGQAYYEAERLLLHFDNPNMTGIALTAPVMILVLMAVEAKKKNVRIAYWAMVAVLLYMIAETENRGSALTGLVFAVLAVLATRKKTAFRVMGKGTYAVLKLLPIVMLLVYVGLYSILPHNLEFMDKPFFSGREAMWRESLVQIMTNPFAHSAYEDGGLNLFLMGAGSYGILSMIGYFWLLFTFTKNDLKSCPVSNYLAYLGFHLCLFQQSFESTLITGSFSVYIWSYMLLGVASMKPQLAEENSAA